MFTAYIFDTTQIRSGFFSLTKFSIFSRLLLVYRIDDVVDSDRLFSVKACLSNIKFRY